jgi:hypothetical protein
MANPSLAMIPSGYKAGKLYSVLPKDGTGDGTFVRAGEKTRINSSGIIETIGANVSPIDYIDGTCPVLNLEPQQTQIYELTDVMSTQTKTTVAGTYTVGFYGTGTLTFSGSFVGSLVGTGANERVELTFTATAGSLTSTVSGTVEKSQLVLGSYLGSYIPNATTGTVTRLADVATNFGDVNTFNSEEGVLFVEMAAHIKDISQRHISISDGTISNSMNLFYGFYGTGSIFFQVSVGGVVTGGLLAAALDATSLNKIACVWKENRFEIWINGVKKANDSTGTIYPVNTLNKLSFAQHNNTLPMYAKISQLKVFKTALSDSELTTLTA